MPPASVLLKKAAGLQKGSSTPHTDKVGKVNRAQLEEIATMSNAPIDMVKKYYAGPEARSGLMAQIAEEKVVGFLLESAKVKEVAPKKPKKEALEKPKKNTEKKSKKDTEKKADKEDA